MQTIRSILLVCLFLLLSTGSLHAQWTKTKGPRGDIRCFAVSGTNLFAATVGKLGSQGGGILRSTNNGTSWTPINTGLPSNTFVGSLAVAGPNLYAGTGGNADGGVFLSTNNGTNWTAINRRLTNQGVDSIILADNYLFVGSNGGGVFRSSNNGKSWTHFDTGIYFYVTELVVSGTDLFAVLMGGELIRSKDNGANWTEVNTGFADTEVRALAVSGSNLFAGTFGKRGQSGGVIRSTDNGRSWTAAKNGLMTKAVNKLAVSGTNLFAGTYDGGVFLSTDEGSSWAAVNPGLTNLSITALAVSDTSLFAGTQDGIWTRPLSQMIKPDQAATTSESSGAVAASWHVNEESQ